VDPAQRSTTEDPGPPLGEPGRFAARSAVGFLALVVGALALAAAVRMTTSPVVSVDRAVASDLNAAVAPYPGLVTALQVLTFPGSPVTSWVVLSTLTLVLVLRGKRRLALYVAVTGLGAAVLSPLLKQVVDRIRPVVATPVATAGGPSFPSGHTLGVTVWVGVVLLVLLPVVPQRHRRLAVGLGVALVVLVGLTRISLGVHFLSDVLAGWLIGAAWLLVTATAFRSWRRHDGLVVAPPTDGLAPEIGADLMPNPLPELRAAHPWTTVAQLVVAAVLMLGVVVGIGFAIVGLGPDNGLIRADVGVVAWLAAHRVAWFDPVSAFIAELGNTGVIVGAAAVAAVVAHLITRRWRPSLVIVTVLVGEVIIFVLSSIIVDRPRPPVPHLDAQLPPTSSFPSGHAAAATCLYGAIAVLVMRGTRAWWRWLVLAAAVVVIVAVAFARLYRGAHHPTDVLGSILFSIPWLMIVLKLVGDGGDLRPRGTAGRGDATEDVAVTR
jgi:undecaprenyl-diphosphatase